MKSQKIYKTIFIIFVMMHVLLVAFLGQQKNGYHYDEKLTFALANNKNSMKGLDIVNGQQYTGDSLFEKYAAVEEGNSFNYKMVWKNQANDVHPPLYYAIIHTICSFFPGKYTRWFGLIPNIVCLILIDCLLYIGICGTYKDELLAILVTMISGLSLLFLNMTLFFRMYSLMTVWVVAISMLYMNYSDHKFDKRFYCLCYIIIVAGTMTQYYFLIYLFFLSLYFGSSMLFQKKWKESLKFCLTVGVAGISCIIIFPSMLHQIFGHEKRGGEAFEAIQTGNNFVQYIKEYIDILNTNLLSSKIVYFLIACVVLVIIVIVMKGRKAECRCLQNSPRMILFAVICYTLLIAKIAPYRIDRYVFPIGWGYIFFAICFFKVHLDCLINKKHIMKTLVILIMFSALLIISYQDANWRFVYRFQPSGELSTMITDYSELPVLYIYKIKSRIICNAEELKEYSSYTFAKPKDLENILESIQERKMVIYISTDFDSDKREKVMNILSEKGITQDKMIHLYDSWYASAYLIQTNNVGEIK